MNTTFEKALTRNVNAAWSFEKALTRNVNAAWSSQKDTERVKHKDDS